MKTKLFFLFIILSCILIELYLLKRTTVIPNDSHKVDTKIFLRTDSLNLGKLEFHKSKIATFSMKNIGSHPLMIKLIEPSCGCTVAKYIKKPIAQGETTTVLLEFKPNSLGYFSKTADVICNVPEGY